MDKKCVLILKVKEYTKDKYSDDILLSKTCIELKNALIRLKRDPERDIPFWPKNN